ncbi:cell division protein FtsQ/DivIB [Desulfurobacterium sp.]
MKRPLFIIFFILIFLSGLILFIYSPMKIEKVKIKLNKNTWGSKITDMLTGQISINSPYDENKIKDLSSFINSLPWVKKADISFIKGTLTINIKEEPVTLCIVADNEVYNIGENGYILGKKKQLCPKNKTFFYKGKASFFTEDSRGFPKVTENTLLEISLITQYLKSENPINEKPKILLTDTGIKLLYPQHKIIVFLGNGGNSWQNFKKLFKILSKPYPGYYDLRFSGLLIEKGRKND